MTFLVNEQNVSVMYIDINAISLCFDLNISQQDECFCSKLGLEVEHAKSNLKTSISQIWVICHLLPFVRVGQYYMATISQYMTYTGRKNKQNKNIILYHVLVLLCFCFFHFQFSTLKNLPQNLLKSRAMYTLIIVRVCGYHTHKRKDIITCVNPIELQNWTEHKLPIPQNPITRWVLVRWNCIITRILETWKLPCYIRFLVIIIRGEKTTKKYKELGPA